MSSASRNARVVGPVGREEARPHHGLGLSVAGERLTGAALARQGDRVSDLGQMDVLEAGDHVPDLAGAEGVHGRGLGRHHARLFGVGRDVRGEHLDRRVAGQPAALDADVGDHAAVGVERRVEDQRLQRRVGVADRRRHPLDHRLQQLADAFAGLRRYPQDVLWVAVQQMGELVGSLVGLGGGQVDLVQRGHDREAGVAGQVEVRQRLGLQALRGVDQQDRSLAGGQRPRHLVGEVDVTGGVDQVELEPLVLQPDGLGLDRDAPLALQIHLVEVLGAHVAALDRVRDLEHAVGQRRLAVVDMRHDAEVADVRGVGRHETPMVRAGSSRPWGPARRRW